ncbi:DsbA family protein [Sphingomonas soli]|uniref:DsbA family protein n=1 Tax=Sphingomonas soli TaxID=266127 RepID=UPI00082DCD38|nr:thioredoxin domain-containing protein [Sphingomonas soli]
MRLFGFLAALLLISGVATPAAAQKRATATAKAKPPVKAPAKRWVDVVVRTPEGGYRQGNPNARVKLVEYGARTCPTCAAFAEEGVGPLRAKYIATGKVSYEFRDLLVHGAPDAAAALINQCVPLNRFFPVLDAMFAGQPAVVARLHALERDHARHHQLESLPPAESVAGFADALGYVDFIKQHGVTEAKARACLADRAMLAGVGRTDSKGAALGVRGTPSFMINGSLVTPYTWDGLEPLLIAALG